MNSEIKSDVGLRSNSHAGAAVVSSYSGYTSLLVRPEHTLK